jgi:hypothetical protein
MMHIYKELSAENELRTGAGVQQGTNAVRRNEIASALNATDSVRFMLCGRSG